MIGIPLTGFKKNANAAFFINGIPMLEVKSRSNQHLRRGKHIALHSRTEKHIGSISLSVKSIPMKFSMNIVCQRSVFHQFFL